jgi:hypothetical protein
VPDLNEQPWYAITVLIGTVGLPIIAFLALSWFWGWWGSWRYKPKPEPPKREGPPTEPPQVTDEQVRLPPKPPNIGRGKNLVTMWCAEHGEQNVYTGPWAWRLCPECGRQMEDDE